MFVLFASGFLKTRRIQPQAEEEPSKEEIYTEVAEDEEGKPGE